LGILVFPFVGWNLELIATNKQLNFADLLLPFFFCSSIFCTSREGWIFLAERLKLYQGMKTAEVSIF